jgi:uncharacterized protein (TIGR02646 family)
MIQVQRSREPAVLTREKTFWTNTLLNATSKDQRNLVEAKYRHKDIKKALVEMFHGKCAYCESIISHIDYGHIEHFRPKSVPRFRNLTFDWNNLFLACAKCNGPEYKGIRFPEQNEGGPPINPCDDLPDEHLEFLYDSQCGVATVTYKTERGRVSVDLFGLNRPDLRAHRSKVIKTFIVLSRLAENDIEAKALLGQFQNDEAEYAAFARNLTRKNLPR